MKTVSMLQCSRTLISLGCLAVVLVAALAEPVEASGQTRDRSRVPSELWKVYPLDPSEGTARIRVETESDGQRVSPPSLGTGKPAGDEAGPLEQQRAPDGDASKTFELTMLVLSLLAFFLFVLALRATARAARNVPVPPMRFGGAGSSPLWFVTIVARPSSSRPTKKGSIMSKPRRKQWLRHASGMSVEPSHEPRSDDEVAALGPTGVSGSATGENESDPAGLEAPPQRGAGDEARVGEVEETNELTRVAEEVQTVLASAQDAAAKIRSKAEEEAKRLREEAASEAEAEVVEARRIAEAHRTEVDRVRAEAEAFATETRAGAYAFGEELRTTAEREAARIVDEAQRRLDAADAEAAQKVQRAESQADQKVHAVRAEIKRHEERLDSILVILRGMSSQLEDFLGRRAGSAEVAQISDESLDDVLRPDRSAQGPLPRTAASQPNINAKPRTKP